MKLSDFKVALQVDQHEIKEKIAGRYKKSGLTPAFFQNGYARIWIWIRKPPRMCCRLLIDERQVVKTKDDLFF